MMPPVGYLYLPRSPPPSFHCPPAVIVPRFSCLLAFLVAGCKRKHKIVKNIHQHPAHRLGEPLFSRRARHSGALVSSDALVEFTVVIAKMDSTYRPQSPDLYAIGNAPESPDLSGLRPPSPDHDLTAQISPPAYGNFAHHSLNHHNHHAALTGAPQYGYHPTSVPQLSQSFAQPESHLYQQQSYQQQHPQISMAPRRLKNESDDDDFMPDAPAPSSRRTRGVKLEQDHSMNGQPSYEPRAVPPIKSEELGDPTLGCQLKTSFPVARIKRIMQADEDIGKVAQVTPTVVSRALELFMIKLISAAAQQARGPAGEATAASKGPRRVLAQHLKKAVLADKKLDFLEDYVNKVPDAPSKSAKKDAGSESEDAKPVKKKKGKKRKESGDDF